VNIIAKVAQLGHGAVAITEWLGKGGEVVDNATAQARADICLKCPEHNPDQTATVLVGEVVRKVLEAKNKIGLTVNNEDELGSCKVCGCVLKLQCFEPLELIDKNEKFDKDCWKLKP